MNFLSSRKILKRKEVKKPFSRLFRLSSWPLKTYIALFFAFSLGATLLFLSRSASPLTLSLQKTFLDTSGCFFSFFNDIGQEVSAFTEAITHRHTWLQEKRNLETENLTLHQKLIALENVKQENHALRKLLNVVQRPEEKFLTVPVLSNPLKGLNHTFLIGAGALQGIRKGQGVLSPYGVVGQISQVGENVSRIMPLTHHDSRIPVVGVSSRIEAIVAGDGSSFPVLTYLQENKPLAPAEILVTSHYGGRFPSGYVVGRLQEDGAGQIRIHPFILWDRLEFVQVMTDFSFQATKDEKMYEKEATH